MKLILKNCDYEYLQLMNPYPVDLNDFHTINDEIIGNGIEILIM